MKAQVVRLTRMRAGAQMGRRSSIPLVDGGESESERKEIVRGAHTKTGDLPKFLFLAHTSQEGQA